MKRSLILFFSLFLFALSACGNGEAEQLRAENDALRQRAAALEEENAALTEENEALRTAQGESGEETNPIDLFYDEADDYAASTAEMSTAAGCRAAAWETEARNVAGLLKDQLPLQEDRDLVDAYLAAVEAQLRLMDEMAVYPVSDVTVPQNDRMNTVGTLAHVLRPASYAQIWRDTFYQLLGVLPVDQNYTFVFDPETARQELAEILEQ